MFCQLTFGILWVAFCGLQGAATAEDEVCCTEQCQRIAEEIKHQMGDPDPCKDFHNHVCGNWNGSQETEKTDLKKKALQDLIDLLENAVKPSGEIFNATDKLIAAYWSCTNQAEDIHALKLSVKRILDQYDLGHWPVLGNDNCEHNGRAYLEVLKKAGPRSLFQYLISDDDSKPIILMTKPSDFEVDGVDYVDYVASQDSKNEEAAESTTVFDYSSITENSEKAYKEFIEKSILLLTNVSSNETAKIVEEIFFFEKNLSLIAFEAKEGTEKMNLSQLSVRLGDNFPMDEVLQKDFEVLNITISKSTEVKVQYIDYYTKVVDFLKNLTSTVGLKNYIMWKTIRNMAKAEETKLHELYLQYKNKTSITGEEPEKRSNDTKLRCLLQLLQHDLMYSAAANFYSQVKFDRESKNDVLKLMEFINSTFMQVIENNTWMSNATKQKAIKRITKMATVIGYPDWIIDNSVVNSLYKFAPKAEVNSSFVESFHGLQENEHIQQLLKLNSSYFDKTYENVTLRSHAFYDVKADTIGYPAASLVTHYRKRDIPRSLIFGTIGTIIAQLLTSAIERFDDEYRPGKTRSDSIWDNDTTQNFCERSSCLNNTEECYDREYHNTSYEQLRDYFGVRVSHMALYQSKVNYTNPFLLPGKEFDTEDKIFFTLFGSLYCPYSVNEKKVQSRADIPVEAFPNSLNEIVSRYKDFNMTFRCKGSVNDTCDLMPPKSTSGSEGC